MVTLPSERYVAAVLNAEAANGEPGQSLRALAILARTYALNGSHFAAAPGHLAAELCDSTDARRCGLNPRPMSWMMRPELPRARPCGSVDALQSLLQPELWGPNRRCWGSVAKPAWNTVPAESRCPYCLLRDTAVWHAEVPLTRMEEIAHAQGWRLPSKVVSARVVERSASHRALRVAFTGGDGTKAIVSATALRFGIGRALGWDRVRSDAYDLGMRNDALVFDGRGHGHGVGLCQAGSTEMAAKGKSTREILAFYFPELRCASRRRMRAGKSHRWDRFYCARHISFRRSGRGPWHRRG